MPMLSRCAFEGMRIPFKICAAARLCRGAGCCGPSPHDLEIREWFTFVPEADETNRRTNRFGANSFCPGVLGRSSAAPVHEPCRTPELIACADRPNVGCVTAVDRGDRRRCAWGS